MSPAVTHHGHQQPSWHDDLPSLLFLATVLLNTALIAVTSSPWLHVLLALSQALFLAGCQEAKHMAVHRTFLSHHGANDAIGIVCAALFGVNFIAYRYFHLRHHRATCTNADPEGRLYMRSWKTRWIWLLAPLEVPWVAYHQNRVGWTMVPPSRYWQRTMALAWMVIFIAAIGFGAWQSAAVRQLLLWAYVVPATVLSWFDFVLTQAEHYGVPVTASTPRRDPGAITQDILLPPALGWITLHRSLHRVHHCYPAVRWHQAPRLLRVDPTTAPMTYLAFARRWMAEGPRLWRPLETMPIAANVDTPMVEGGQSS